MREMNAQRVVITMRDGNVLHGLINIGSSRRLSDFFRKTEGMFIVLFDATIGEGSEKEVFFLNRNHILWAKPDDKGTLPEKRAILTMEEDTD